jgi:D-arabinose 1-dehydrogenase-like Zn-dependent alcohol dehydrogenase
MGNRAELERLANFVVNKGITPVIDSTFSLADARKGFEKMADGDVFGKIVFTL